VAIVVSSYRALSDVGLKRVENQDSFLVAPALGVFVVADGMGGHRSGGTASRIAVEELFHAVEGHAGELAGVRPAADAESCPVSRMLAAALRRVNDNVYRRSFETREHLGMGSTLTAVMLKEDRAIVCHVGDSRAYLIRGGVAVQLTNDHTVPADELRAGNITEAEARASRWRHAITRSIGNDPSVEPEVASLVVEPKDTLLLCSDGLTGTVTDRELAEIVNRGNAELAAAELVELAKARGGTDNITVVVITR